MRFGWYCERLHVDCDLDTGREGRKGRGGMMGFVSYWLYRHKCFVKRGGYGEMMMGG